MGLAARKMVSADSAFYCASLSECYFSGLSWFNNPWTLTLKYYSQWKELIPSGTVAPIWSPSQKRYRGLPLPPGLVTSWDLARAAHEVRADPIAAQRKRIAGGQWHQGVPQDFDAWILLYSDTREANLLVLLHSPLSEKFWSTPKHAQKTRFRTSDDSVDIYREILPFASIKPQNAPPPPSSLLCDTLYVWPKAIELKLLPNVEGEMYFKIPQELLLDKGVPLATEFGPSADGVPIPKIPLSRSFFNILHDEDHIVMFIRHRPRADRQIDVAEFVEPLPGCTWLNRPTGKNLINMETYRTPDFWLHDA